MKFVKMLLAFLVVFCCSAVYFAQLQDEVKLLDEIIPAGRCEYYWSTLDVLLLDLLKDNDSIGYVVLQGSKDNVIQTIVHKEWVAGHLARRKFDVKLANFDTNRIQVLRGAESATLKVQLWKSSGKGEKPVGTDTNFDYTLKTEKPIVFSDYTDDPGGLCPGIDDVKVFGDFLRANPQLKGNIVIYKNAEGSFQKAKSDILSRLDSISPNRLRFFFSSNSNWHPYELWFVPKRNK